MTEPIEDPEPQPAHDAESVDATPDVPAIEAPPRTASDGTTLSTLIKRQRILVVAVTVLAIAVITISIVLMAKTHKSYSQHDVDVDQIYCTLSGVSLADHGPQTHLPCFKLLYDTP
ncbi:MAG: hypothetical protein LBV00_07885 [Propionibacteriaceae bacterium]|jgi:hypothetical protein|nr:hypothetical protein [Propionibacteriaceae bacterium]